ncbi:MAG: helix-turn-helix transcriptional regulator [Oscillospiraceae bacterium]|nr:helix-turn-helix transcriptional regulator [Oscillospiraceae bacterium]
MNEQKLRRQIGANIAAYRKRQGLTQAGLAEKLNYSDKAVSKWERGESAPDVVTLMDIAEQLHVSVKELLEDPNEIPADSGGRVEKTMERVVQRALKRKANKNIILGLSSILVWIVALLLFVILSSLRISNTWLALIYAIPANCIVMLSLRSAWKDFRWNRALISGIMWGSLVALYMTLLILGRFNIWKMFLLGIPGQIAILLWFRLFRTGGKEDENG